MHQILIYAAVAAFVASTAFATGWSVRGWKEGNEKAIQMQAEQAAQDQLERVVNMVSERTAEQIAGIRIENRTIVNEVRRETIKEPIYNECRITAGGLRLINQARAQSGPGESAAMPSGPIGVSDK